MRIGTTVDHALVSVYKYMGVYFTPSLSWASTHTKFGIQAKKSILSIKQYQKSFGYFPIKWYFKLFDALVKPVLCYASQVWGYCYVDTIESVQNDFCKDIFVLRKQPITL